MRCCKLKHISWTYFLFSLPRQADGRWRENVTHGRLSNMCLVGQRPRVFLVYPVAKNVRCGQNVRCGLARHRTFRLHRVSTPDISPTRYLYDALLLPILLATGRRWPLVSCPLLPCHWPPFAVGMYPLLLCCCSVCRPWPMSSTHACPLLT